MAKNPKRKTRAEKVAEVADVIITNLIPRSFESPESSTIIRATYDPETLTMRVTFKKVPVEATYQYNKFPAETWVDFEQAESKGVYFSKFIRPFYVGHPVVTA